MDRRLSEAAWTGNVESLLKLIEDDPCVLRAAALAGGETPLHIACLAGHRDFVQKLMELSHGIAKELNQDGLSPLHIASARGHTEIVKVLVEDDPDLCLLKGRERRIPLHNAAIKGRVQVLKELLSAKSEAIAEVTARGETALHLAVKNTQFEALRVLVEHLKQFNKEDILNSKDGQGNTILHLAVSRKQYEAIELMLKEEHADMGMVEVNPLNRRGLTPLDLLLLFQSEAGDREIEEILRGAGARKAEDLQSLSQVATNQTQDYATNNSSNGEPRTEQPQSRYDQLLEFFKYDEINDSPREVRNILLVIAILITTATYQAVLSPPGGVWQEDCGPPSNNNGTHIAAVAHAAGKSVMGSQNLVSFGLFLLFNSLGFFTSLHMIFFLTLGFPLRLELHVSIFALVATYDTCMTAIAPSGSVAAFFTVISIGMLILIEIASVAVRNHFKKPQGTLQGTNQESA